MISLRTLLLATIAIVVVSSALPAQDALNMTLFDHLNPVDSVGLHSALWGYTAPDGREYALFGSEIGTHIIDITTKPIRQVAYIWGPRNVWRELKVYKNYAYVVTEDKDSNSWQGVQIIDLSALPDTARLVRLDTSAFISSHTIFVHDHYLYAMGSYREFFGADGSRKVDFNNGVVVMDLEPDPTHPRKVAQFGNYYFHDAWVRNDTLLGAAVYGQGCDIWDIHDLSNPIYLTTITYPFSGTHNAEMTERGHYVTTSDEIGQTPKSMKVWDISDLENIRKVADYSTRPFDIVHNVHTIGRYTVASWYTAGVRIIDMDDPTHPREVGYYDTWPGASGSYDGVWEVYAHFPSGKIIAGDRSTGLYVLQFNNAIGGSVSGRVTDAATHAPLPRVAITVPQTGATVMTDAFGRYYVGGVAGDVVTLTTKQFGYRSTSQMVTMTGDEKLDIQLDTVPVAGFTISAQDRSSTPIDSFSYAIADAYLSTTSAGPASVVLPRDTLFTLRVGKWGFLEGEQNIAATASVTGTTVTLAPGYQDSVSLDLGWSLSDPSDGAVGGRWNRIIPSIGIAGSDWAQPPSEPGGTGGYVYETGTPLPGQPVQVTDVNNGTTTLTSPVMDLSHATDPTIIFDLWFVHYEQDTVRDSLRIQLSNDDGKSWVTAYTEARGRAGWKKHYIYPKDLLPVTDRMRIRFRASDTLGNAIVMAAMDNFQVYDTRVIPTSGVAADPWARGTALPGEIDVLPNPSRGNPTLSFTAPAERSFRLDVIDELGRVMTRLHDGPLAAGAQRFAIQGDLPAGWYVARGVDGNGRTFFGRFQIVK